MLNHHRVSGIYIPIYSLNGVRVEALAETVYTWMDLSLSL